MQIKKKMDTAECHNFHRAIFENSDNCHSNPHSALELPSATVATALYGGQEVKVSKARQKRGSDTLWELKASKLKVLLADIIEAEKCELLFVYVCSFPRFREIY